MCNPLLTATLFTIITNVKIWEQTKSSTDEQIKMMWYIHTHACTGILLSHKHEILPSETTLMDLEGIMPSEKSQGKRQRKIDIV